jgi:hypothetical protein
LRKVFSGVIQELVACWAEPIRSMMEIMAIYPDHRSHRFLLSCYARMPF